MATSPIAKLLPALELNPGNRSQNLAEITGSVKGLIFALAPPPVTLCSSFDEKMLSSNLLRCTSCTFYICYIVYLLRCVALTMRRG